MKMMGMMGSMAAVVAMNTPPVQPPLLPTYNTPWVSSFTLPTQDSLGWSIVTPSATSQFVYVANDGDDTLAAAAGAYTLANLPSGTPENPVGIQAYATPEAALATRRAGFDDFVFFKRGDRFDVVSKIDGVKGLSSTQRNMIAAYGSGERPILEHRLPADDRLVSIWEEAQDTFGIIGIEFYHPRRDPNHIDFQGWATQTYGLEAIIAFSSGQPVSNLLLEDNKATYFSKLVTYVSSGGEFANIIQRRNIAAYSYKNAGGAHPQGASLVDGKFYVEDDIYIRNGYLEDPSTTSPYSIHNHSIYSISVSESYYTGITSYEPSSISFKFTADVQFQVQADLTGAAVTEIPVSWVASNTPSAGNLYLKDDLGTILEIPYDSYAGLTFTIPPYDFSLTPISLNGYGAINVVKSHDVAVIDCLSIGGDNDISFGGNETQLDLDNAARFDNFIIRSNVTANLGDDARRSGGGGTDIALGMEGVDNQNSTIADNIRLPSNPAITNKFPAAFVGYDNGNSMFNNRSIDSGTYDVGNTANYSNLDSIDKSLYVDGNVTVLAYLNTQGIATWADYEAALLQQRKGNWNPAILASGINTYVRTKVALTAGSYVIADVADATVNAGETAEFTYDIAANTRIEGWQWYDASDDSVIVGETSNTLSISAASGDDGNQYYCQAFDGDTYHQSSTATLTVNAVSQRLNFLASASSNAIFTPVTVAQDEVVNIDYLRQSAENFQYLVANSADSTAYIAAALNNAVDVRWGGGSARARITVPAMTVGGLYQLKISRNVDGNTIVNVNGTDYVDLTTTSTDIATFDTLNSTLDDMSLANFELGNVAALVKYAINSGSISTENAYEGTGTMVFNNVVLGHWVTS